jgi:hypothetical protein
MDFANTSTVLIFVCVYVITYVYIQKIYICIYLILYIYIYAYIYIYIYIHTHVHTCTFVSFQRNSDANRIRWHRIASCTPIAYSLRNYITRESKSCGSGAIDESALGSWSLSRNTTSSALRLFAIGMLMYKL